MPYKLEYHIKWQHRADNCMYENYDSILATIHGIKLSGGIINGIPIKEMDDFQNLSIFQTSYDYEIDGNYYVKNTDSENSQNDFNVSDVDELRPFETNITEKFNLDLKSYFDTATLEYNDETWALKYLWKPIFTFKRDSNRKIFIKLMTSKQVWENVLFSEIYGELDKTYVGWTLEKKRDKVIRNLIADTNDFLYSKIKLKKTFWLAKKWLDRHVYRIA